MRKWNIERGTGSEDEKVEQKEKQGVRMRKQNEEREENRQVKERFWQKIRQVEKEEENEVREIGMYDLRLGYMYENCTENDVEIQRLLDEQREMLDILRMRKREFTDECQRRIQML